MSLFPQRLETTVSGIAGNRSFCLLRSYPKPREQPRDRVWLRVRFPNAIVPASQEKTEPVLSCKAEKRQSQFSPPSSDCGKTGKYIIKVSSINYLKFFVGSSHFLTSPVYKTSRFKKSYKVFEIFLRTVFLIGCVELISLTAYQILTKL